MLPEAAFAAIGEGCAGSWEGEIPPYLYASSLQVPGWLDPVTDDVLSLIMAQLSLAIPILYFSWERMRSEEQCQPWAGVLLISEAEALKEAALRLSWSVLMKAVSRASALAFDLVLHAEIEKAQWR